MNIGMQMKAIKVEALGGPAKPKTTEAPKPVEVTTEVQVAERELVTA